MVSSASTSERNIIKSSYLLPQKITDMEVTFGIVMEEAGMLRIGLPFELKVFPYLPLRTLYIISEPHELSPHPS